MSATPQSPTSPAHMEIRYLGSPQKRQFTPSAQSRFCDIKKRRLLNGVEGIQPHMYQTPLKPRRLDGVLTASPKSKNENYAFTTPKVERTKEDCSNVTHRPKFKARPVPKTLYQPSVVIKASDKPLTVPEELQVLSHPNSFPCSTRASSHDSPSTSPFKARAMPCFDSIALPPKRDFSPTCISPFTLRTEERGREKSIAFNHKLMLEAQLQSQATQFIANPLPIFPPPKGVIQTRQLTVPQEFQFPKPQQRVSLPAFPAINAFRARPMPDFSKPFQPVLMGVHTNPVEFELHTEIQAQSRAVFDEKVKEEQRREELREALAKQEREKLEEEEIKVLRRQMEFAARAMPPPPSFRVQRSSQLLTVPQAPVLHTAMRAALHCCENCNPNTSHSHASTVCSDASMSLCDQEEEHMDAEQ